VKNILPKVSIIIPCYNQAHYLVEAVDSVIEQTYANWECIIVNDGSPDDTASVAKELLKKDGRIRYEEKENGGLSSARNYGIKHASGEYILPLDADDKISVDYVLECINAFKVDTDLAVVYCEAEFFGEMSGKWNLPSYNLKALLLDNMIFCTAMFHKSDWERAGGYDEQMKNGMEDWEFWISLLKTEGKKVLKLPNVGFYYRIRGKSMVENIDPEKKIMNYDYVCRKHIDFVLEQTGNPILNYIEKNLYKEKLDKIHKSSLFVFGKRIKRIFAFNSIKNNVRR